MRLSLLKEILCLTLVATTTLWTPTVSAQDDDIFCSGDDIAEALDGLECSADGVYLSPEVAADEASYRCGEAASERACRTCFNKTRAKLQVAFRALSKAGLLDRSAVKRLRSTFAQVSEEICAGLDEEPSPDDQYEDTPAPSPGMPESPQPPLDDQPAQTPMPENTPWIPEAPSGPGDCPGQWTPPPSPPMPSPGFGSPTPSFPEPELTPPPMPTLEPWVPEPELTPPPMPTWDPGFSQPWFPEPELTPSPMPTSDPDRGGSWLPEPPSE
jgi:hypothetical protein